MKLEPESKKELGRIAGGTAICTAAMWVDKRHDEGCHG